jgi:hypothetical protein
MENNQLQIKNDENNVDLAFYSVSTSKLKNLYLFTLGLYSIYWFYKNWKLQQPFISKRISPTLRSIFPIFSPIHWLNE